MGQSECTTYVMLCIHSVPCLCRFCIFKQKVSLSIHEMCWYISTFHVCSKILSAWWGPYNSLSTSYMLFLDQNYVIRSNLQELLSTLIYLYLSVCYKYFLLQKQEILKTCTVDNNEVFQLIYNYTYFLLFPLINDISVMYTPFINN